MTAKQRVVLAALRDAQHERDGDAVGAGRIAEACPAPWRGRPDLVTAALVLLERDGMVLAATGSARAWKIGSPWVFWGESRFRATRVGVSG